MLCNEFVKIAREKCSWASDLNHPYASGCLLPGDAAMSVLDIQHKSLDGFFHVIIVPQADLAQFCAAIVKDGAREATTEAQVAAGEKNVVDHSAAVGAERLPSEREVEKQKEANLSETQTPQQQPSVFHLPDADSVPAASQAKRVLQKYPDRVPVLFRQSPMLGLPAIDKKLLVPHKMRCDELKWVLKKQFATPTDDVNWDDLCVVTGCLRLKIDMSIKEIYDDHKDLDGCLHIMLGDNAAFDGEACDSMVDDYMEAFDSLHDRSTTMAAGFEPCLEAAKERAATAEEDLQAAELRVAAEAEKAQHFAQAYLEVEADLKAASEQVRHEAERAERADGARQEAEQRATREADRIKELEQKLVVESCEKAAIGMELKRIREEMQHMLKRVEAAEKRSSDLALKVASADEYIKVADEKVARAELAQQASEAALRAEISARAQGDPVDDLLHVESVGATSVGDWSYI
jgi:GABA(A) receptor-associated protein